MFQASVLSQFQLGGLKVLEGDGDMVVQFLPFQSQGHSAVGTDEELAAKLALQIAHKAGDVGLAAHQYGGRFRETFVFGHIIKYPVVIIGDFHNTSVMHI